MLLREAGKRENGDFLQCLPCLIFPEHIPGVVLQIGRSGRENGDGEYQQKLVYGVRDGPGP